MPGGGAGGGGSGAGSAGFGGGSAVAGGYGGAGGIGASWGGSSAGEREVGWRGPDGRIYPWVVDPNDPYGIPLDMAGYELAGNNLTDTRGYMTPQGQQVPLNAAPIPAMIPDARGGQRLDPRFVGLEQRAQGQEAGLGARGMDPRMVMGALAKGPWSGFNR